MRTQGNGVMQMLSQLMGLAGQAQQMDESQQLSPLKAQMLQAQLAGQQFDNQHAEEQMRSQQLYHQMMSLPQATMGMQSAGYAPEEVKLMLRKLYNLGNYDLAQAGKDYVRRALPKESATIEQLAGGHM